MDQESARLYMEAFAWAILAASLVGLLGILWAGYLLFRKDK